MDHHAHKYDLVPHLGWNNGAQRAYVGVDSRRQFPPPSEAYDALQKDGISFAKCRNRQTKRLCQAHQRLVQRLSAEPQIVAAGAET